MVERYRQLGTILTNTISAIGIQSGVKHNVIPAVAEATLDCRLVPALLLTGSCLAVRTSDECEHDHWEQCHEH